MTTIKQEYKQYLADNFKGQKISKPLFFNGSFSLRFDLQEGETNTDEYFAEVVKRSALLFEAAFDAADMIFLVFRDFKWRRRKIRFSNYCFKQIYNLKKQEVNYSTIRSLYDEDDIFNSAIIKLKCGRVNYKNILTAIANTDFPPRQPEFTFRGFSNIEIYFINIAKNLVLHMYDDRGLDMIASDIATLKPIYKKFNNWILEFNRAEIDEMMSANPEI